MPQIKARDNHDIYVRELYNPLVNLEETTPFFLLHGFGMHSAWWLPYLMATALTTKVRFILPDFRGFGKSHLINLNKEDILLNYVEDIEDIISFYGFDKVLLGGISMGALTGLKYAEVTKFKNVIGYLHIDQSPKILNDDQWKDGLFGHKNQSGLDRFDLIMQELEGFNKEEIHYDLLTDELKGLLQETIADFVSHTPAQDWQKLLLKQLFLQEPILKRLMPMENIRPYLEIMSAYTKLDYDFRHILKEIDIPFTIMTGMKSTMYPPAGQLFIQDQIKHSKLVRFESSGHTPFFDQPILFSNELSNFVREAT